MTELKNDADIQNTNEISPEKNEKAIDSKLNTNQYDSIEKVKKIVKENIKFNSSDKNLFTSATIVKKDEPLDVALKRFKRKNSGIISEVRKREAYVKPSVKRKTKSKEARRRKKRNFSYR